MSIKKYTCSYCGSLDNCIKHGKDKKNNQRYRCTNCKKTFILDTSPLKGLRISDHNFKRFIGYMVDDTTLEVISRNLSLDIKTIHYYKYIIFQALLDYQDTIKLTGTILIDETFIPIREKSYRIVKHVNKEIRGISFNQLCIITMIDLRGVSVAKVSSRAMSLPHHYVDLFSINIDEPTKFIHDGNLRGTQFMNQFSVKKINGRKDETGVYSVDLVDHYHSNIKRYFFKHSGLKLKNVQHYLNFFVYRQNYLSENMITDMRHQNRVKNQMTLDLFKIVLKSKKKTSYSTFLKDEGIEEILLSKS